jgi:hypothetical protein
MRRIARHTLIALLFLALASPGLAQNTSPGRNAVAAATFVLDVEPPGGAAVLTATLTRGRAKRLLMIDATMVMNDDGPVVMSLGPLVNGVGAWPNAAAIGHCGAAEFACTVTGHWWLDLDATEIENPGAFIGQPLTVQLFAGEASGIGQADVSMRVWMQKK